MLRLQKHPKPQLNLKSPRKKSSKSLRKNSTISIFEEYGTLQERRGLQEPSDSYASSWLKG